ncbi:MAG: ATP-binding protein [Marmoricola sp.]
MRRFVAEVLRSWGEHDLLWDANLIASQLATNSLTIGESPFRGQVSRVGGVVRLRVDDIGSAQSARPANAPAKPERGVAVVDKLADRWGYDVRVGATVMWAELDTRSTKHS